MAKTKSDNYWEPHARILESIPRFQSAISEVRKRLNIPDKGVPYDEMVVVREKRLKAMKLYNVRNQRSSQFSGGMKRRLSVILATLGEPQCVFLDEPTTGMDPINKHYQVPVS